jgi:hypothetical protein
MSAVIKMRIVYLLLNVVFQLHSKTTHFQTHVYVNIFLCFDVNNSLLKSVQELQVHPV